MADDLKEDKDALDALELEAKEFDKVGEALDTVFQPSPQSRTMLTNVQDAEIDRILRAFRLDAYEFPRNAPSHTRPNDC